MQVGWEDPRVHSREGKGKIIPHLDETILSLSYDRG